MTAAGAADSAEGAASPLAGESPRRTGRGRVRSEEARHAILSAAWDLMEEAGFSRLTMEKIAARAEVSKATVYRWWSNRAAVAMETLLEHVTTAVPFLDSGSAVEDVCEQMRAAVEFLNGGHAGHVIAGLIGDAQHDPELAASFRSGYLAARRERARAVLQRGIERGELRDDVDLEVTIDALYGPIYYRLLIGHGPLDPNYAAELARIVLSGLLLQAPAAPARKRQHQIAEPAAARYRRG